MDPTFLARLALLSAVLAVSSPSVTAPTPAAGYTIYIVQSGDTLYSIALKFETSVEVLQQANRLGNPNALYPGQKLQVPIKRAATATPTVTANTLTYTVKAGDTLATIAARFNLTVEELAKANGIKDVNMLRVGQVLIIPTKAPPSPPGITLVPPIVKQGSTLAIRITATHTITASGAFGNTALQFVAADDGAFFALTGISRCANIGTYPVTLALKNDAGETTPLAFDVRVNATNYPVTNITLTPQMAALLDPAIERAENARVTNLVAPFTSEQFWRGPFRSPLTLKNPVISAVFGQKRSYNGGAPGACGHEGQDYAVAGGVSVYAPADGIVVLAEPLKVRGSVVFINHGLGVYSGFYHLSKIEATAGQRVTAGDPLGQVGTTGFSTGDHLHWSMWVGGVYVDPNEWMARAIP